MILNDLEGEKGSTSLEIRNNHNLLFEERDYSNEDEEFIM